MFDKQLCINNIYNLAKRKGLKIGDLEEKAGVSRGYLSRISKPDGASPAIETLTSVAEQLGTSIDYLVYSVTDSLSINGVLIVDFVEKLLSDTVLGRLEWLRDPYDLLMKQSYQQFELNHPLFSEATEEDDNFGGRWIYSYDFCSLYDKHAYIAGDSFHAQLDHNTFVYLIKVDSHDADLMGTNFELYLWTNKVVKPLCNTCFLEDRIFDRVEKLYSTLDGIYSRMGVDPVTKSIMEKYINGG